MSALLLDTNVFAMVASRDGRIPKLAFDTLANATTRSVSAVSFYEISQKVRLGKWPEMKAIEADILERAKEAAFDLISVTPEVCQKAARMRWTNRDPFDRLIAAVAIERRLTLISSDRAFDSLDIERIWD